MGTQRLLPLTYDECRARFRRAAVATGRQVRSHPIEARGPEGQSLSIDVVTLGHTGAASMLAVLSGTHGVEGFIGSTLQCDLLDRVASGEVSIPDEVGVVLVHAVNPWGMAWWRRQNESNVDLNRNWRRDHCEPFENPAYGELHPLACPDTDEMPDVEELVATALAVVAEKGLEWVRDGITAGQYTHPDGLHYGGHRTEESNLVLESIVTESLAHARRVLTVDLHTAHGPRGEVTVLCDEAPGSARERFLTATFPTFRVEATTGNPDATTGPKSGQIANGFVQLLPGAEYQATSVEFGTASDEEQLLATINDQWVHRRGDRSIPAHAEAVWAYRCCFTPDDRKWEADALRDGRRVLDDAVDAVRNWATVSSVPPH